RPPLSASRDDGGGRLPQSRRGHAARWSALAAAGQSSTGRPGQGTGTPGPPVLPLRRRLQHLCALAGSGGTGHRLGYRLPGRQAPASGQPSEECGRPGRGTPVPRPPADEGWTPRHRAEKPEARQGSSARHHAAGPRQQTLQQRITEVNRFALGWVGYYRDANCRTVLRKIDQWLRRRLRCVRLKHCKNPATIAAFLRKNGVEEKPARQLAASGKGWWRLADSQQAKWAMPNAWFAEWELMAMEERHVALDRVGNRRGTRSVCPVV